MDNQRRHSRAEAGFEADVMVAGNAYPVITRNLSMKGVLATANAGIESGKDCTIRILLAPAIKIEVDGTIIRADEGGTAVEFRSMDDDSFSLLHRLMQWNAEDADIIDEELRHPGFSED